MLDIHCVPYVIPALKTVATCLSGFVSSASTMCSWVFSIPPAKGWACSSSRNFSPWDCRRNQLCSHFLAFSQWRRDQILLLVFPLSWCIFLGAGELSPLLILPCQDEFFSPKPTLRVLMQTEETTLVCRSFQLWGFQHESLTRKWSQFS